MFIALSVSIEAVRSIRQILAALKSRCPDLADPLERAATSMSLHVAEGSRRIGRDRLHHFRIAAGSCDEARPAIALGEALGHLDAIDLTASLAVFDREAALLYGLTHPRT